jgi:sugar lactone lactonase YvrE
MFAASAAAVGRSKSDNVNPDAPGASYDGTWRGSTSQPSGQISFVVAGNAITSITISFAFAGDICTVKGERTVTFGSPLAIASASFAYDSGIVADLQFNITGIFSSATAASGNIAFTLKTSPGEAFFPCRGTASATWSAQPVLGNGTVTKATPAASGPQFAVPLDATPSPDGSQVFFTAVDPATGPQVFTVSAVGGANAAPISTGSALGAPLGIAASSDGNTLFVADPAGSSGTANDNGGIFKVAAGGGPATLLTETADYAPRSIVVAAVGGSDSLYFVGTKTDGTNGIFKDSGGNVTPVLTGAGAGDPSAIAVASDGTLYFIDASSSAGKIIKVAAGGTTGTALGGGAASLSVSYPGGLATSQDGSALLVAVFDPATGGESIARVDASSGAVTQNALGLTANQEPGGLHRAAGADIYSFVDVGAGTTGSGIVYVLSK